MCVHLCERDSGDTTAHYYDDSCYYYYYYYYYSPGTSPCMALQRVKTKWTRTKTKWSRGVAEMPLPDGLRHSPMGKAGTVACNLATSIKKHTGTNR